MLLLFTPLLLLFGPVAAQSEDERYLDNGLAKECRPVPRRLDVLFLLDGSGSVSAHTFDEQRTMLKQVVEMIELGSTQLAIMQYASYTKVEVEFDEFGNKTALLRAIDGIRNTAGTTRTGKALSRALTLFEDGRQGARQGVDRVVIVVTDGHSRDNPVPPAEKLKQKGIRILTLGIGEYVNRDELVEIAGDEQLVFQDLKTNTSVAQFVSRFTEIATEWKCEHAREPDGATVTCAAERMQVQITMTKPFEGAVYMNGHYGEEMCSGRVNGSEISMNLRLGECGLKGEFSPHPHGFVFSGKVVVQLHPRLATSYDHVIDVSCFYSSGAQTRARRSRAMERMRDGVTNVPCTYRVRVAGVPDQCPSRLSLQHKIEHVWSCDQAAFSSPQRLLLHSCQVSDAAGARTLPLLDDNGCPLLAPLFSQPRASDHPLAMTALGTMVALPHSQQVRFRCRVSFCEPGECERMETRCPSRDLVRTRRQAFSSQTVGRRVVLGDSPDSPVPLIPDNTTVARVPPPVAIVPTFSSTILTGRAIARGRFADITKRLSVPRGGVDVKLASPQVSIVQPATENPFETTTSVPSTTVATTAAPSLPALFTAQTAPFRIRSRPLTEINELSERPSKSPVIVLPTTTTPPTLIPPMEQIIEDVATEKNPFDAVTQPPSLSSSPELAPSIADALLNEPVWLESQLITVADEGTCTV